MAMQSNLAIQRLGKSISQHVIGRRVMWRNGARFNAVSNVMITNVNMPRTAILAS
jgi:hypothetical protein